MSNQEIPIPPKANLNKDNELEKLVGNLKIWSDYEAAHIAVHQSLIQQLNACQPGTDKFAEILFAVKISGVKSTFCEKNIVSLQEKIIEELPRLVNKNGIKTNMPNFDILINFLQQSNQPAMPIQ